MNDLVERLSSKQPVEIGRPEKNSRALKESINRNYVHILFKSTGTELGIRLNKQQSNLQQGNFDQSTGTVRLVGGLILNYEKVKCSVDIDLETCEGLGVLKPVDEQEYQGLMAETAN